MNKLSEAIEQAKKECLENGNGEVKVNENITIFADWENCEVDDNYSLVAIYIYENNISKFYYQLEETKTAYY